MAVALDGAAAAGFLASRGGPELTYPNRFLDLQGSPARKWKEGRKIYNTPIPQNSRVAAPEDTSQVRHDDISTAQWPCGGGRYALPADATASGGAIRRNEGPTTVKKIL